MAIAANMSTSSNQQDENNNSNNKDNDEHDQDMVMPGFRFHPTEEELIEFYLRRKVEGKRFNVELITFLDLYRYDPWELPGIYSFPTFPLTFSRTTFFLISFRFLKTRYGDLGIDSYNSEDEGFSA